MPIHIMLRTFSCLEQLELLLRTISGLSGLTNHSSCHLYRCCAASKNFCRVEMGVQKDGI